MTDRGLPGDPLDPSAVPPALQDLLPLAEEWGIGDDIDRDMKVCEASDEALQALVEAVAAAPDDLWDWLVGPESQTEMPSREYVILTDLTQAADLARVLLQQRPTSR